MRRFSTSVPDRSSLQYWLAAWRINARTGQDKKIGIVNKMTQSMTGPLNATSKENKEKASVRKMLFEKQLTSLANDTKWDELISAMRVAKVRLSYRYKWINGHVSEWDQEWWYHLPIPFVGVLWFDIQTIYMVPKGRLIDPGILTYTRSLIQKLSEIGLHYQEKDGIVRIFGYQPYDFECFGNDSSQSKK